MKKFAFITDIHLDEQLPIEIDSKKNWDTIIADLKSKNITEIVFGGDIGSSSSHKYFFDTLDGFSVNLILGNHDDFSHVAKFYNPNHQVDELYYSFEDDHHKYLFLDSSSGELSTKQLDWLADNTRTEKALVIFIHHPVIEVETIVDKKYPLNNRNDVRAILESVKQPVTLFSGHYHTNDEKLEKNLRQIVTFSSSYQIEKNTTKSIPDNSEFGYRIIEIGKDLIKTETVIFSHK